MKTIGSVIALVAAVAAVLGAQQTPRDLFERARMLDESSQKLPDAIALYEQAAVEAVKAGQRELAATAQLRAGLLYERIGKPDNAARAFQTILSTFADQDGVAEQARGRLASTASPSPTTPSTRLVGTDDSTGSPSPDGRWLSFVDWDTGDLALRDLRNGEVRRLTNKGTWQDSGDFAEWSVFSPDSTELAYAWSDEERGYDLRVMSIAERTPRVLVRLDEARFIEPHDWSPDGRDLLVRINLKDGTNQLALVGVADGRVTVLETLDWSWPITMAFSRDGRFVAYDAASAQGSRRHDVFVLARDGSRKARVVDHAADDTLVGWSPDGRYLIFSSDRMGSGSIWSVPVRDGRSDGSVELLRRDIGRVWPMGVTDDGTFYYSLETGIVDIFVATLGDDGRSIGTPAQLTDRFVGANSYPAFSADGEWIAFLSRRSPGPPLFRQALSVVSMTTGDQRDLTPELSYIFRARWSADGRSLLVNARDGRSRQGIFQVDAETGATRALVLAEPNQQLLTPRWSDNGQALVYLTLDAPLVRVVQRNVQSGEEREVFRTDTLPPIMRLALSPGGDRIAYVVTDRTARETSLNVISTRTGESRRILAATFPEDINYGYDLLEWSPDGRFLYYVLKPGQGRPQEAWRVEVESGAAGPLGITAPVPQGMAPHPDGRRLAFSAGETSGEIWAMEHFLPRRGGSR